jgi:hypothetical protein
MGGGGGFPGKILSGQPETFAPLGALTVCPVRHDEGKFGHWNN